MEAAKQIRGVFLSFEEGELEEIYKAMIEDGYKADTEGMKQLIVDALTDTPDEEKPDTTADLINQIQSYLKLHPGTVQMGMSFAKGLADMIIKRKK